MTTVGDVLELSYGKALKASDRDGGDVPVVGSGGVVGGHSIGITDEPTIVVGRKGSIGSVTWIDGPAWPIDTTYFVRPKRNELDLRWTYWMLKSLRMETMNKSAAVPGLNRDDVYRLNISVPSLSEQGRIAAILDHADALRAKRRQVFVSLETLTNSIFSSMFGTGGVVDATLEEVSEVQGGLQISSKRAPLPVEAPYLRVANVQRGRLNLAEVKTLRGTPAEIERTLLVEGDLLFVEGHANPEEVGRVALWSGEIPGCVHQNHLIRSRLDASRVLPLFAATWLNSRAGSLHLRRAARTTSGLNTISASTVRSAPLPVPPMEVQREFVRRVEVVARNRSRVSAAEMAGEELCASLRHDFFSRNR